MDFSVCLKRACSLICSANRNSKDDFSLFHKHSSFQVYTFWWIQSLTVDWRWSDSTYPLYSNDNSSIQARYTLIMWICSDSPFSYWEIRTWYSEIYDFFFSPIEWIHDVLIDGFDLCIGIESVLVLVSQLELYSTALLSPSSLSTKMNGLHCSIQQSSAFQ